MTTEKNFATGLHGLWHLVIILHLQPLTMKAFPIFKYSLTLILLAALTTAVQAQDTPSYKDMVVDNPEPEADLKVIADYVAAIEAGDIEKLSSVMADDIIVMGPTDAEGENKEKAVESWKENFKTQKNINYSYVVQTFRVLSGDLKGDWVSTWGDYTFTAGDKEITFPAHTINRVEDGKINWSRSYFDNMHIAQKLGYKVMPPESKD